VDNTRLGKELAELEATDPKVAAAGARARDFFSSGPNHECDVTCICPVDGEPLLFWRAGGRHACSNKDCKNAHGMVV
jgi:hypothetical protein